MEMTSFVDSGKKMSEKKINTVFPFAFVMSFASFSGAYFILYDFN